LGHLEKALECADKAIRLSPRDPFLPTFYEAKGVAYFLAQRDAQAIETNGHIINVYRCNECDEIHCQAAIGYGLHVTLNLTHGDAAWLIEQFGKRMGAKWAEADRAGRREMVEAAAAARAAAGAGAGGEHK
jgi:tetratricopeptide (TPR) repeat protein